ncbi:MAG TPA: NYN domain-containing protein [Ktedonobacteraceae bacterium]|nr:NYN domain-containing protein [Ktedonobacteraceae bacterium]
MLECPSCQQALPPHARFCTRCGVRLSITTTPASTASSNERYAREKRELAARGPGITSAMLSLLPFVYEDRRAENQALFASTIENKPPLEDPTWGRVAFVLGAYGNYMYRYPLSAPQKQQLWQALLWAVFYERCFRRKYLPQRLQQLLHFLHGCLDDTAFVSSALDDLEALRPYLEISSLKRAIESLNQLPEPPVDLLQRLNTQLTSALEHLANAPEPSAHHTKSALNKPVLTVPHTGAPDPMNAGNPVAPAFNPPTTRSAGERGPRSKTYATAARTSMKTTRRRKQDAHAGREGFLHAGELPRRRQVTSLHAGINEVGSLKLPVTDSLSSSQVPSRGEMELTSIFGTSPSRTAISNAYTHGETRDAPGVREAPSPFADSGADANMLHRGENGATLLTFLDEQQRQQFFESLRSARLENINQLLSAARHELFAALSKELVPGERACQAPRRPIRLGKRSADRFAEARRLLHSTQVSEQLIGLRMFEMGARETTHPDYTGLAREWMLYARAVVQGSPRVVDDWEELYLSGEASWEELENLAAFYRQTGYPAEALRVLRPEIEAWRAPVSHIRLALACALSLLLEPAHSDTLAHETVHPGPQGPDHHEATAQKTPVSEFVTTDSLHSIQAGDNMLQEEARAFLLAHLEHWPHPLCCLAWLVLAQEVHGHLHPRQQAQWLSAFQELAERPLPIPDPARELSETQVADLEERLARKERCEEGWFFWVNDYAERHPHKYAAWTRLVDASERMGRLARTETALQHLVEMQYYRDYARYQEGTPLPRARFLRGNLERLFEFYLRHRLLEQGAEAFNSCYPTLSHLWDARDPLNRRLLTLTAPYLEARQRNLEKVTDAHREPNTRDLSRTKTLPLENFQMDRRVGIFVDYENIAHVIPRDMEIEEVGRALVAYAASFGEVVCRWASASPHNLSNLANVRGGLEAAHFQVRFPRRELQFSSSKKNLADFALLECLSEAAASERPDIYLIVSGDRDYYERICSLLDSGHSVRVIASADSQHLSSRYRELEQQRARARQEAGYMESDFFIDNLTEILCPLVQVN